MALSEKEFARRLDIVPTRWGLLLEIAPDADAKELRVAENVLRANFEECQRRCLPLRQRSCQFKVGPVMEGRRKQRRYAGWFVPEDEKP